MKYVIDSSTLTDIADAVREKSGTTESILVSALAQAITDIPSGGESNGLFFQEFSNTNTTNIQNQSFEIDLDVEDVDWLIVFPLHNATTQYSWTGGVFHRELGFGGSDRTSYGATAFTSIGCKINSQLSVSDYVLTIGKHGSNCYINADALYGIVGKLKEN